LGRGGKHIWDISHAIENEAHAAIRGREYSCENCPKRKYRRSIDQRLGNVSINHHTRSIMVVTSVKGRVQPAWASHLRAFDAESTHDASAAKIRATRKPPRPPRPGNVCLTVVLHTQPEGRYTALLEVPSTSGPMQYTSIERLLFSPASPYLDRKSPETRFPLNYSGPAIGDL
jgi:hypothetical protein